MADTHVFFISLSPVYRFFDNTTLTERRRMIGHVIDSLDLVCASSRMSCHMDPYALEQLQAYFYARFFPFISEIAGHDFELDVTECYVRVTTFSRIFYL